MLLTGEGEQAFPSTFQVAFSFAGEQRALVRAIAEAVRHILGPATVFFDEWYESYIAGADADLLLQAIYRERASLVVVCLSPEQASKPWTQVESDAIRERINRARASGHRHERWGVLQIEVAEGGTREWSNTIAPAAHRRPVDDTARLIVDRLRWALGTSAHPSASAEPVGTDVDAVESDKVETVYVTDFASSETLVRNAMALYESRLPADERYDHEMIVDLIRRHLSDEFGPEWTVHLVVALFRERTVGMLLCYEHLARNLSFISYLVAYNPRVPGTHPPDVGEELAQRLMAERHARKLPPARFLFEVDDPALAANAAERRRRASRLEVFGKLAPLKALHLRALDIPYLQPNLDGPASGGRTERPLLLCYAAPRLGGTLSKANTIELLTWIYTALYGDDIFEDPSERAAYGTYTRALLERVANGISDPVRLLKYEQAGARTAADRSLASPLT